MKIRVTLQFDVVDTETDQEVEQKTYEAVSADMPDLIRDRLIGPGFLAHDLAVGAWETASEIIL